MMGASDIHHVFELKSILTTDTINLCARCQTGTRQLLAFVSQDGDLVLHYVNENRPAIIRRVPWFLEREKRITSLAFHPSGSWLLLTGWDGFLHIVPALALVDSQALTDQSWNPLDLTSFPSITTSTPTCCVWWQSTALGHQMAVIGTEGGEVVLVDLNTAQRLGSRRIQGAVSVLHICHDNADTAYLLMTCEDRQQWRVLLEDRDGSWFWPEDSGKISSRPVNREEVSNGLSPAPSTRSRLQGLKQMSVEKLAIIRQRLAETRSKATTTTPSTPSNVASRRGSTSSDGSARSSDTSSPSSTTGPQTENLRWVVNAFLWPQTLRGRQVFSAVRAQSNVILTYKMEDLEHPYPNGHKLSAPCRDVLVTERFLYVTDSGAKRLSVISSVLSECESDGGRNNYSEYNPDSVIDTFEFPGEERILALYKLANSRTLHGGSVPVVSASGNSVPANDTSTSQCTEKRFDTDIERLRGQPVDTCVVVTSSGVYNLILKQCPVRRVLDHLLAGVEPDNGGQLVRAEILASVFGLDLQKLLELAGDVQLSQGNYVKAVELYKLARCGQMKSMFKLAAGGHTAQLLIALQEGLGSGAAGRDGPHDTNPLLRCQLANLAVLCYAQQLLSTQSNDIHETFLKFLRHNQHYDEQMAVNVAGQGALWSFLTELAYYRGLLPEVLEAQAKVMSQALVNAGRAQRNLELLTTQSGFWECISETSLREALLQRPQLVRIHIHFVTSCLSRLSVTTLLRLATLYDPSVPALRPGLVQLLRSSRCRERDSSRERDLSISMESSLSSYSEDFSEPTSPPSENVTVMEELVTAFILLLLHLWHVNHKVKYVSDLVVSSVQPLKCFSTHQSSTTQGVEVLSLVTCELSAGFAHAALLRNSGVFAWGQNSQGCVGVGPSMSRLCAPRPVLTFNSLRTRVHSVACGRTHTLALTDNGVYAWGSSSFGQLGIGDIGQSPHPKLVTALLDHRVVSLSAGQYHSVALTSTGRVFTWGWGVHGQLGHKSVEDVNIPKCIAALNSQVVSAVAAGHAHTLFLLSSGQVLGCGSSVFGQLGTGMTCKSSTPVPVCNLPESITTIATGYFHNLALSKSNRLYTWGSSPQVLRVQAQAQKKARLLLQQQQTQQHQHKEDQQGLVDVPLETKTTAAKETDIHLISLKGKDSETESSADTGRTCEGHPPLVNGDVSPPLSPSTSPTPLASPVPKLPNNVRLNGTQEVFVDPLNATIIFPGSTVSQPRSPAVMVDNTNQHKEHTPDAMPIPDLLAEAVPKIVVDLVSSPPTRHMTPKKCQPCVTESEENRGPENPPQNIETEMGQLHLLPTLVDTSQVEGLIAEIACGCHHSALVTEEGRLYTWGRNLDGQLGHGSRKEATAPTIVPDLRATQVACGAEYTLALNPLGQLFGWGSNSYAQLGRMPQKDANKGLGGKLIMLSATKRVVKIPHSAVHNRVETPQEICGIPQSSSSTAYSSAGLSAAPAAAWGPDLTSVEVPPYGTLTLHLALQNYYPYYSYTTLLNKCLELENFQAAARLSLLSQNIPASFGYHLNALAANYKDSGDNNVNNNSEPAHSACSSAHAPVDCVEDSTEKNGSISSKPRDVSGTPDHVSSSTATFTDESGEGSQTDNSCENSEMHAFAFQGGNEEMSEGTDSEQTKSNHQPSDETSSLASVSLEDHVAGGAVSEAIVPDVVDIEPVVEITCAGQSGSLHDQNDKTNSVSINETSMMLAQEVVHLIQMHLSFLEEEQDCSGVSQLLEKAVHFWVARSLPTSLLEDLVQRQWQKLSYPFAVLLFCSESSEESSVLIQKLSTPFTLKLCATVLANIKSKGECSELSALLTRMMAQKDPSGVKPLTVEQVMLQLCSTAPGSSAMHIQPLQDSVDNNNIVAFSCGHRLTWLDYHAEVMSARSNGLPVGAILSDGEESVFQHACPSCVSRYLQRITL